MSYISNQDAGFLWNNVKERSWTGLYKTIQENRNSEDLQMSYNDIDNIARAAIRLNNQGIQFPGTPTELAETINQEAG